jgi:hypothetical protein
MEQSIRVEKRDEGQLDYVYLAHPIPVASAISPWGVLTARTVKLA